MPHLDNWATRAPFRITPLAGLGRADTPFQWTKQIASHYGGTTNVSVIQWPARIKAKGEFRPVLPIAQTLPLRFGSGRVAFSKSVNGTVQRPFDGTSMVYTFGQREGEGDAHHPSISRCSETAASITTAGWRVHVIPFLVDGAAFRRSPKDTWDLPM